MAQFARPANDITTGNWTSAPLYASIDETPYSDSDFITSARNASNDTFEVALSPVSDPVSSIGHILRIRIRASKANGSTSFALYQGAVLVASGTTGTHALTFSTFQYTLSAGEADAITDYSDLRIRVVSTVSSNSYAYCSWAELEVPDPAVYDDLTGQDVAAAAAIVDPPAITQVHSLSAPEVTATPQVNQAVLEQEHALATLAFSPGVPFMEMPTLKEIFGLATLSVATHIPVIETTTLGQAHALQSNPFGTDASNIGSPSLTQEHAFTGSAIESAVSVIEQASILTTVDLLAGDILASPTVTSPLITQNQHLEGSSLNSPPPVVGGASLSEIHNLQSSAIITGFPTSESPALGPHHLISGDIAAAPGVQQPSMDALYSRAGDYILSGQYLGVAGTPLLYFPLVANPPDNLSATDVPSGVPVVEKASLVGVVELQSVVIASAAAQSEPPALGQEHSLSGQNLLAGVPTLEKGSFGILAHSLTAEGAVAGVPLMASPAVGQVHICVSSDVSAGSPSVEKSSISESVFALTSSVVAFGSPFLETASLAETVIALEAGELSTEYPALEIAEFRQTHALGSQVILPGAPLLEIGKIDQLHHLVIDSFISGIPVVEGPVFTENVDHLAADELDCSAPGIENAAIGQTHALLSLDATATAEVQAPKITQAIHALAANDTLTGVPITDIPSITQVHALLPGSCVATPDFEKPLVSQIHSLVGEDVLFTYSVEGPSFFQAHALTGDNATFSMPEISSPEFSQAQALIPDSLVTIAECDKPQLSQEHYLVGIPLQVRISVEKPTLGQVHELLAPSIATGVDIERATVTGVIGLSAADVLLGAPLVERCTFAAISNLSVVDIVSGIPEIEETSMEVILGNPWYYYAQL